MIGGTYFIVTGTWDPAVAIASLPYALGATTVIFGKHIDKARDDRALGIHTLPVIVGERAARAICTSMLIAQYAIVGYLVITRFFAPTLLLVFLAYPSLRTALRALRSPRPAERPESYPTVVWPLWFVRYCFAHNRRWGTLFLVGLIGDVVLRTVIR